MLGPLALGAGGPVSGSADNRGGAHPVGPPGPKRVCLLVPPARSADKVPERVYGCTFTYYRQPELPMLYVASLLEQDGHAVELKDYSEDSWQDFTGDLASFDYDIYVLHTVLLAESVDLRAARQILEHTEAHVIFFGPHPTLKPRDFLPSERCVVARGEAEFIIRDLVRALPDGDLNTIKGISCLDNGELMETESYGVIDDLDSLPFPSRHLLDEERDSFYNPKLPDKPVTLLLSSRGCSFRCYYCVPNSISWARELEWKRFHDGRKPPVKLRSPENIAKEFSELKQQGYRSVSIIDDMFLFGGKKRIMDISERIRGLGLKFGILARCNFVADEELVKALADAGCVYVDLGIESMDQRVLDDIRKDTDVSEVYEAIRVLSRCGVEPKANIMIGSSSLETRESIDRTVSEISDLPLNYCMFSIATPFPGTEFAEMAEQEGWTVKPEIYDLESNLSPTDKSLVSYPGLSREEMEQAVKQANRRFYLRPRRAWFFIRRLTSLKALRELISTGWKVIR